METKRVIKFLFDRTGKSELDFQQLELAASMELRWFTPTNAKRLIELALKLNYLKSTNGNGLTMNFDPSEIIVPVGFKPHADLIERLELKIEDEGEVTEKLEPEPRELSEEPVETGKESSSTSQDDLFMKIIAKIAEAEDLEKTDVISIINKKQRKLDLEIEVLALLIARERGVDIEEFFKAAEPELAKRVKEQF